jgi:O-antigen/teichoic acid export membrane protein
VLAGVAAVGGTGVLGTAMLGVPLIGLAFGEGFDAGRGFDLSRGDLVLLSVSTALFLVALVFQAALVAMGDHRGNALGWAAGLATMAGCAAVPADPVTVAEIALVLGCVSTTCCLGVRLALTTRRPLPSDLRETTTCEASRRSH